MFLSYLLIKRVVTMASTLPLQSQFPERKFSCKSVCEDVCCQTNDQTLSLSFVVNGEEKRVKMRRQQLIAKAEVCGLFIRSPIKCVGERGCTADKPK